MPQYLAVDYLNDMICRKQATLSRMLIACPPHLRNCNSSTCSFAYREPWLKGDPDMKTRKTKFIFYLISKKFRNNIPIHTLNKNQSGKLIKVRSGFTHGASTIPIENFFSSSIFVGDLIPFGVFKSDSKQLISEAMQELTLCTNAVEFESHIQFDGIRYLFVNGKSREVVPSSVPSSDSDNLVAKEVESSNPASTLLNIDFNKSISFQPYTECFDSFVVCHDGELCDSSCKSLMLEPLLSADTLDINIPSLPLLLVKLNVFSVPDPTENVKTTLNKLFEKDRQIDNDNKVGPKFNPSFTLESSLLTPYWHQTYEISQDLLDESCSFVKPVRSIVNKISNNMPDFSFDKNTCKPEQCLSDLNMLADSLCFVNTEINMLRVGYPETLSKHSDENQSSFLSMKECVYVDNEPLQLSLPSILENNCFFEDICEAALEELELDLYKFSSDDFALLKPVFHFVSHFLQYEMLPDIGEDKPLIKYMIPEPKMNLESFIKKTSHDKLELIRKFLDVEPEVSFKNLHITLPWDPVSHACEEMDFLKQALQPEKLIEVDSTKQRYLPTDLYSEGFDMVLNSSVDGYIYSKTETESTVSHCPDVPTVKLCSKTEKKSRTNFPVTKVRSLNSSEQGFDFAGKNSAGIAVKNIPSSNYSLDPLSNFMMLLGKHQEKDKLPWSTNQSSLDEAASTTGSLLTINGKNLAVKRIRSAYKQSNDTAVRDKSSCEKKEDSHEVLPRKKIKKNFPSVHDTPNILVCSKVIKKSKWSKNVQVCITGTTFDMLCAIEQEASSLVEVLLAKNVLPPKATLPSITRENTRYLIKQQEQLVTGCAEFKSNQKITLIQLQLLHQIVSVYYLIVQVSYTSALAFLHTTVQQFQKDHQPSDLSHLLHFVQLLKHCSQRIKFLMCQDTENNASKVFLVHPKISELHKRLSKWFYKRRHSQNADKVVVVCCTVCRYLFMNICKELCKPDEIYPEVELKPISVVVNARSLDRADILQALEKNNVLILGEKMMFEDFPWDIVGLVVEYELQESLHWKNMCINKTIKHLALEAVLPNKEVNLDDSASSEKIEVESKASISDEEKHSLTLIGSEKFTALGNLLHLLETRYELIVVERNYREFKGTYHPDLIIDEQTCIVLENVTDLQKQDGDRVKTLLSVLTMLKRKFTTCFVLVVSTSCGVNSEQVYPVSGLAPLNIARLHASAKQLSDCTDDFQVKVFSCFTAESCGEMIFALVSKTVQEKIEAVKRNRSWISVEMSDQERFLLYFPSINSCVAQRLLSVASLHEICQMTNDQLLSNSDALDLPRRFAQDLYDCLHSTYDPVALSSTSVYLRPDYYKDDTPCLGKDHAKRKPNSHYFQNDGAKWRVKIEKDLNSFGENALYGVASNDHHFARTNTRSARDFQQSVHVKAQPSQHQEHAAMNDFNKPSDGRYFSQLPTCSSEFFQTELSKRSDSHIQSTDVDKVIIEARKKLKEFVRLNPDRIQDAEYHCGSHSDPNPPFSCTSGFFSCNKPCEAFSFSTAANPQPVPCSSISSDPSHPVFPSSVYNPSKRSANDVSNFVPQKNVSYSIPSFSRLSSNDTPQDDELNNSVSKLMTFKKSDGIFSDSLSNQVDFQRNDATISGSFNSHMIYERSNIASCPFSNQLFQRSSITNPVSSILSPPGLARSNLSMPNVENYSDSVFQYPFHRQDNEASSDFPHKQHLRSFTTPSENYDHSLSIDQDHYVSTGSSGSTNIGIAQPFLQHPWTANGFASISQSNGQYRYPHVTSQSVILTPGVRKKTLTYEKVPGRKDGQTRLTFY